MAAMRAFLVWAVLAGCGGATVKPPPPPPPPRPVQPAEPSEPAGILAGYVDAHVMQVVALPGEGAAVLLLDETTSLVLPIFIGGTEATSIDLRMRGTAPQRPLTHDLLDSVMKKLHGTLVKVQVDELRDGIFFGSIFVRTEHRILKIDSRPSDALALAIGNKVPIYVAKKVFEQAGVAKDEILRQLTPGAGPTT
jgi:bifunctional DNase/RNase